MSVLPRVSVIGTGYLGATHAVCMASLGFDVVAIDIDPEKVDLLNRGRVPFHEPGMPELLESAQRHGRITFTTDYAAAKDADVHFLCVGTPSAIDGSADLSYLRAAVTNLAPHLDRKSLVVGKSTVPPGTAAAMTELLTDLAPAGSEVELAWQPEFLREGHAVEDTLRPNRLVFGVRSEWALDQLNRVFAPVIEEGTPVVVADLVTAELVKIAANTYLATKISFANGLAELCDKVGGDVATLVDALGYDSRIGRQYLGPGIGYGGGCLPKDLSSLLTWAESIGAGDSVGFLRTVREINDRCRDRVILQTLDQLDGNLQDARICVLGVAFKPDSDDVRESPSLEIARRLHQLGARVTVHDPAAMGNARRVAPELTYAGTLIGAADGADVVLVLTEWREFREMDPRRLGEWVASRKIVDGRLCLDAKAWTDAGWHVAIPGRPVHAGPITAPAPVPA
nr:UDP-glucose/GDP-mannose dehydrogenase family protein [Kibdelosporangium sp. MJ126-NF4]CEL19950.1 UDP-glucose dehydrogenase [Kibdelosporangium sp. MJ126-NF4]CTQ97174.1 UDP-glucose dehydrogenase (EC 1.1.1.22) [Kibdelosporangium sp. MJ126-NF4]